MLAVLLLGLLQSEAPGTGPGAEAIPLTLRVNQAIALGVDFLRHAQQRDGSFLGFEVEHPGGATALAAFTLAKSGVRNSDPLLTRALAALSGQEFKSVYSAAVHVLACESLHDPARVSEARPSLDFLLANRQQGVWAYPWGHLCDSNTQFALLALRAARRMGLEVPEAVWLEALEGLEIFRDESGGFTYAPGDRNPNAGITAAALASLAVLQEVAVDSGRLRSALERKHKLREDAERWLERRFDPQRNTFTDGAWTPAWRYAYLWALERWCGLTQRERVAERDWYSEGASWLLEDQARDGSFGNALQITDTCFALLFLRRATVTPGDELAEIYAEIERVRAGRPVRPWNYGAEALRLTDWWLAGPFPKDESGPSLLEPPFDPGQVEPRERGKIARKEWERVTLLSERWTDLEVLTERPGNRQLWLLSTGLLVPDGEGAAPCEARLWLELDEGWDVWLDGQRISRERRRTPKVSSDVSLLLALAPGAHRLTVVLEDRRGPSAFGALLGAASGGAPPAGLRAGAELGSTRRR